MAQGPNTCGTGANNNDGGTTAWTNPGNITAQDVVFATCGLAQSTPPDKTSQRLRATNFGFSIPSGATIVGIKAEVSSKTTNDINGDGCYDFTVKLLISGSETGNDKSTGTNLGTSQSFHSYGGPTDMWGLTTATLTPSAINASTFGVSYKVANASTISGTRTASVDSARITVYYINPITPAQISATSTCSGRVAALKRVDKSASASATSTVSGSIVVIRAVLPTSILASSSTTGSIRVTRAILPATVAATSTMSGNVVATKLTRPATVNAVSTVSGEVIATRHLSLATILASSSVTGGVAATRALLPVQIDATAVVSGQVTATKTIAPDTISAFSLVMGDTVSTRYLSLDQISATSTLTGQVDSIHGTPISLDTILATSSIFGSVVRGKLVLGDNIWATSTVQGTFRHLYPAGWPAILLGVEDDAPNLIGARTGA